MEDSSGSSIDLMEMEKEMKNLSRTETEKGIKRKSTMLSTAFMSKKTFNGEDMLPEECPALDIDAYAHLDHPPADSENLTKKELEL